MLPGPVFRPLLLSSLSRLLLRPTICSASLITDPLPQKEPIKPPLASLLLMPLVYCVPTFPGRLRHLSLALPRRTAGCVNCCRARDLIGPQEGALSWCSAINNALIRGHEFVDICCGGLCFIAGLPLPVCPPSKTVNISIHPAASARHQSQTLPLLGSTFLFSVFCRTFAFSLTSVKTRKEKP